MKRKIYIILAVVLLIIIIVSFVLWWNHKGTIERKYQACQDKCDAEHIKGKGLSSFFDKNPEHDACLYDCKLKNLIRLLLFFL